VKVYDFLGRDIRVNDGVVWPVQSGHRVTMRRGRVTKINETGSITVRPHLEAGAGEEPLVSVRRTDNVVVIV
jgi:hypothetical protein